MGETSRYTSLHANAFGTRYGVRLAATGDIGNRGAGCKITALIQGGSKSNKDFQHHINQQGFLGERLGDDELRRESGFPPGRGRWYGRLTQLLRRNVMRFRGGLVFKACRPLYHSTIGSRVIRKKKLATMGPCPDSIRQPHLH